MTIRTSRFRRLVNDGVQLLVNGPVEKTLLSSSVEGLASSTSGWARCADFPSTSSSSGSVASLTSAFTLSRASYATSASKASASAAKKRRDDSAASPSEDPALIRVILRKDVKRLGRQGDVVMVKRGLMRHELYPSGDAAYATPENVALYALSEEQKKSMAQEDKSQDVLDKLLKALNRKPVIVTRRPNAADPERFADPGVSPRAIREAVLRQLGIQLHPSHLLLSGNIDSYGSYKVPLNLRLPDNRQVELTVHVDRRGKQAEAGGEAEAGRKQ